MQTNQQREHHYRSAPTQALTYSYCSFQLHRHACTLRHCRLIWQWLQTLMFLFHGMKEITERGADIRLTATRHICHCAVENGLAWLSTPAAFSVNEPLAEYDRAKRM